MERYLFLMLLILLVISKHSHSFSRVFQVIKTPRISRINGRYYEGDIEGKFAFAVQQSDDASNFGCGKVSIFSGSKLIGWTHLKTGEYFGERLLVTTESNEPTHIAYEFLVADLPVLEDMLTLLKKNIGEEYLDDFDVDEYGYSFGELLESIEADSEKFSLAVRFGLGSQIAYCLHESESGECRFTCQL